MKKRISIVVILLTLWLALTVFAARPQSPWEMAFWSYPSVSQCRSP